MARRRTGPLLALALLVVLAALVAFLEMGRDRDAPEGEGDRPIPFQRADLKGIALRNERGAVRLEKSGEAWRISEPLQTDADRDAVEGLLSSLEIARVERRLGTEGERGAFGLDPPRATLTLEFAAADPAALLLGDSGPIGGTYYAILPGGAEIAVVSSSAGDFARQDLLGLRDKRLLDFDPWKVRRLRIERGRETVLVERPEPGWRILQPVEAPADGPTVTDLLTALQGLRARSFASEAPSATELRRYGLAPPAARLTLLQEGWDVEKTLLFGRTTGGDRYARTVGRDPVVTVPGDFWEKIRTRVLDLRRKELLDVSQYRIGTITAAVDGGPALVIARGKEGGWSVAGAVTGAVASATVDDLLRFIANLKADRFVDGPAGARRAALARRPAIDLSLEEEPAADGEPGRTQHLVIGPTGPGPRVEARDMAWPAIVLVPRNQVTSLREALAAVRKEAAEGATAAAPGEAGAEGEKDGEPPS
jgi:hypothetical protein